MGKKTPGGWARAKKQTKPQQIGPDWKKKPGVWARVIQKKFKNRRLGQSEKAKTQQVGPEWKKQQKAGPERKRKRKKKKKLEVGPE